MASIGVVVAVVMARAARAEDAAVEELVSEGEKLGRQGDDETALARFKGG